MIDATNPLTKQAVEGEPTKTRTVSMLRGGRDNAGTRLLWYYNNTAMFTMAGREEQARVMEKRVNEVINWLDRHDIKADEGDYSQ